MGTANVSFMLIYTHTRNSNLPTKGACWNMGLFCCELFWFFVEQKGNNNKINQWYSTKVNANHRHHCYYFYLISVHIKSAEAHEVHVLCAIRPTNNIGDTFVPRGFQWFIWIGEKCWHFVCVCVCFSLVVQVQKLRISLVVLHQFWCPLGNRSAHTVAKHKHVIFMFRIFDFFCLPVWQWIISMFSFNLFTLCRKCNKNILPRQQRRW